MNYEKGELKIIQSALADEFGMQIDNFSRINPEDLGDYNEVFFGDYQGQKVFIKSISQIDSFRLALAGCEVLGKNGIPVPHILKSKERSDYFKKPVIIETTVPGISLNKLSPEQIKPSIYESAGRLLKRIHAIKLEGFGALRYENGQLRGESKTWKESRMAAKPQYKYLLDNGFINEKEMVVLDRAYEEISNIDLPQAALLHGDFHHAHIFTDGKEVTGVIDFGGMFAGDPRVDISYTNYYLEPGHREEFNRGYGPEAKDPAVLKYFLITAAQKLIYRHSKGFADRIPEALEILKQDLSEAK